MEAGDAFSDSAAPALDQRQTYEIRARGIVQAFNAMGIGAYTPGERDLALGKDLLLALARDASFPFLAANLKTRDGAAPFAATHVVTLGPLKLGLVGVVGQRLGLTPASWESLEFVVEEPVAATTLAAAALQQQGVDAVIALAHLDDAEEQRLAKSVPGIALVIGGHAARTLSVPKALGNDPNRPGPWLVDAGSKGKHLGMLALYLGSNKDQAHWLDLTHRVENDRQLVAQFRNVERAESILAKAADEPASSPEQRSKRLQGLRDEVKRQQDAYEKRRTLASEQPPLAPSDLLLLNTVTPIAIKIGNDPAVDKLVTATQAALDAARPKAPPPASAR